MAGFASKLNKLRAQSGQTVVPTSTPVTGINLGFRAELTRRSLARPQSTLDAPTGVSEESLVELLGGTVEAEGLTVIRRSYPGNREHGQVSLAQGMGPAFEYFGRTDVAPLFLDTETTGLSGGTGTLVFLLGLAKQVGPSIELMQCLLTRFEGERAMLTCVADFIADTDLLVTYNGKSFDLPLLATRYRLSGLDDPFARFGHFDLLHTTQRAFKRRWRDCTLRTAEQNLLAFHRCNDVSGALAPQAWFDWVRHQRVGYLPGIVTHNELDILSLSALVPALRRAYEEPTSWCSDFRGIARFLACSKGNESAYEFLVEHRAHLDTEAALELAVLARRQGDWPLAVASWNVLAEQGHAIAIEGLAKYYEHVDKDFSRALSLTERLIRVEGESERHAIRLRRLFGKRARQSPSP